MERNNENFRQYLANKFGEKIVSILLQSDSLTIKDENADPLFSQDMKAHNEKIVTALTSSNFAADTNNAPKGWAFDFPGWVGTLDIQPDQPAKKIMIVGLEPHIERYYYQVTYGLRKQQTTRRNGNLFDNKNLKDNLTALFAAVDFYEQFYITDMCFFAPKGNANLISNIKNWATIRLETANKFLLDEIFYINPQIVISSGKVSAELMREYFKNQVADNQIKLALPEQQIFKIKYSVVKGSLNPWPFITLYQHALTQKYLIHLAVPHLASGRSSKHWTANLITDIKDKLTPLLNNYF